MLLFLLVFFSMTCFSQEKQIIETVDIDNFWKAYDKLKFATDKNDSINIIQKEYIDKASVYFKEFIRVRNFTAEEYSTLIAEYPKFWKSIRPETESIKNRKEEIEEVLDLYEKEIPKFKRPNVCFAIGCLRTGGTISDNLILIGTEIAASTPKTDKSELNFWLQNVIGKVGDVVSMVAHEVIHTQQFNHSKYILVTGTISEGASDFLAEKITGLNINKATPIYSYGIENDCVLRKDFLNDLKKDKNDYSNWIYNGTNSKERPADLGYYIGYKIAEDYYNNSKNKNKAITDLLNIKKYKSIFKKSNYIKQDCN